MKYRLRLTNEVINNQPTYRVVANESFGDCEKDEIGGIVHGYHNLSQEGECWIDYSSEVLNNAYVQDNVIIGPNCHISGHAHIKDYAYLINTIAEGSCYIGQSASLLNARVMNSAMIKGNATIEGSPEKLVHIGGYIHIHGNMKLVSGCYIDRMPLYLEDKYPITVNDKDHICIGCQVASLEAWKRLSGLEPRNKAYLNKVLDLIEFYLDREGLL